MTFDEYYSNILREIIFNGNKTGNRTGVSTLSCIGVVIEWDLENGFPMLGLRRLDLKMPAIELEWMIAGNSNTDWLKARGCNIWNKWDNVLHSRHPDSWQKGQLGRVYGEQWRKFGDPCRGVDQLEIVVKQLAHEKDSRRIILSLWSPNELNDMALPPCHILYQFFVRGSSLDMVVYQRSMDFPVGGPHDIAQFALFQHILAKACGYNARSLKIMVGDLHIYENQIAACNELLCRPPTNTPSLHLLLENRGSAFQSVLGFQHINAFLISYAPHDKLIIPVTV